MEELAAYSPYLLTCRHNLIDDLAGAPAAPALSEYFARGKLFRALLLLISAASLGGDLDSVMKAAEAVELLHGASLIHDDIIDDAPRRRGLPALHVRLNTSTAIVLGDYLLLQSFAVLRESLSSHTPERVLRASSALTQCALQSCRGQIEELELDHTSDREQAYFSMVAHKTASQLVAATTIGAILCGGTSAEIAGLERYALNLGIAFQIRDDTLDLVGDPEVLGKPVGQTLRQHHLTLPLIYLDKYVSPEVRAAYEQHQPGTATSADLLSLMERELILDRIHATQASYLRAALSALEALPPSAGVDALAHLAAYVVERDA